MQQARYHKFKTSVSLVETKGAWGFEVELGWDTGCSFANCNIEHRGNLSGQGQCARFDAHGKGSFRLDEFTVMCSQMGIPDRTARQVFLFQISEVGDVTDDSLRSPLVPTSE